MADSSLIELIVELHDKKYTNEIGWLLAYTFLTPTNSEEFDEIETCFQKGEHDNFLGYLKKWKLVAGESVDNWLKKFSITKENVKQSVSRLLAHEGKIYYKENKPFQFFLSMKFHLKHRVDRINLDGIFSKEGEEEIKKYYKDFFGKLESGDYYKYTDKTQESTKVAHQVLTKDKFCYYHPQAEGSQVSEFKQAMAENKRNFGSLCIDIKENMDTETRNQFVSLFVDILPPGTREQLNKNLKSDLTGFANTMQSYGFMRKGDVIRILTMINNAKHRDRLGDIIKILVEYQGLFFDSSSQECGSLCKTIVDNGLDPLFAVSPEIYGKLFYYYFKQIMGRPLTIGEYISKVDSYFGYENNSKRKMDKDEEDANANKKPKLCVYCQFNDRNVVLPDCQHYAFCSKCIKGFINCPICDKAVTQEIKIVTDA